MTADDFEAASRRTPRLVNVRPNGKYTLWELELAGGIPAAVAELGEKHLDMERECVTGQIWYSAIRAGKF